MFWFSADKIFRRTKLFGGQNFQQQVRFSAVLSAEILSDKVIHSGALKFKIFFSYGEDILRRLMVSVLVSGPWNLFTIGVPKSKVVLRAPTTSAPPLWAVLVLVLFPEREFFVETWDVSTASQSVGEYYQRERSICGYESQIQDLFLKWRPS